MDQLINFSCTAKESGCLCWETVFRSFQLVVLQYAFWKVEDWLSAFWEPSERRSACVCVHMCVHSAHTHSVSINLPNLCFFQYGNSILKCVKYLSIQTLCPYLLQRTRLQTSARVGEGSCPVVWSKKGELSSNCISDNFYVIFSPNLNPHLVK